MAFRNHKFRPSPPMSEGVIETVLKVSTVDGVDTFTRVDVNALYKPPLPSTDDYKLSALLQSGSPLNYVNPQIFEYPELDAQHFVEKNLTDDSPYDSRETESSDSPLVTND